MLYEAISTYPHAQSCIFIYYTDFPQAEGTQDANPNPDRYINIDYTPRFTNPSFHDLDLDKVKVFNFYQYSVDSAAKRTANGVTDADSQIALDFMSKVYNLAGQVDGTVSAGTLAQLQVTATAILQQSGEELFARSVGGIYLTPEGKAALVELINILKQIDQQGGISKEENQELVTKANKQLLKMNNDANKLDEGADSELQMVLQGLVIAGAETVEVIQVRMMTGKD